MKRYAIPMIVVGAALAAFGLFSYHADRSYIGAASSGWDTGAKIEIAIGVALLVWGMFLRKESR
jgi:hypothetical protein